LYLKNKKIKSLVVSEIRHISNVTLKSADGQIIVTLGT